MALLGFRNPKPELGPRAAGEKSRGLSVPPVSQGICLSESFDLSCLTRTRLGPCGTKEPVCPALTRGPLNCGAGDSPHDIHTARRGTCSACPRSVVHTGHLETAGTQIPGRSSRWRALL